MLFLPVYFEKDNRSLLQALFGRKVFHLFRNYVLKRCSVPAVRDAIIFIFEIRSIAWDILYAYLLILASQFDLDHFYILGKR